VTGWLWRFLLRGFLSFGGLIGLLLGESAAGINDEKSVGVEDRASLCPGEGRLVLMTAWAVNVAVVHFFWACISYVQDGSFEKQGFSC